MINHLIHYYYIIHNIFYTLNQILLNYIQFNTHKSFTTTFYIDALVDNGNTLEEARYLFVHL